MWKLMVITALACLAASSIQATSESDLVKRLLEILDDKQEEKRTETVGEIMKRMTGDEEEEKRESSMHLMEDVEKRGCKENCLKKDENNVYGLDIGDGYGCRCYTQRELMEDVEKRGCKENCLKKDTNNVYGLDIGDGNGCRCYTQRELVEKRKHSCADKCENKGYMVNIGGDKCECFDRRESYEKRGCSERCQAKDKNNVWGLDTGDGQGCVCKTQRELFTPMEKRRQKCVVADDCKDLYCADLDGSGKVCQDTRELEMHYRCLCVAGETCMQVGDKGLRCVKKRDLEALVRRALQDGI